MVDAVALAGKTGFLYVFNRVTGAPLWPIEERPVPKSDMPGEQASPTQPFPTAPPPFAVQKFTADDINPYILTPEERAHWKQVVDSARNEGTLYAAFDAGHGSDAGQPGRLQLGHHVVESQQRNGLRTGPERARDSQDVYRDAARRRRRGPRERGAGAHHL